MTVVKFYDEAADELLRFALILAKNQDKWVICKHRRRETLEIPGGHRELGGSYMKKPERWNIPSSRYAFTR